ncbi:MAG: hypothetical protein IKA36_06795, partial [Clostridia bacterium]|nr:hypothetical protein [Clostridia bacterium]
QELNKLNVDPQKVILVYNKIDKITEEEREALVKYPYDTCYVEAKKGTNIDELKKMIRYKVGASY